MDSRLSLPEGVTTFSARQKRRIEVIFTPVKTEGELVTLGIFGDEVDRELHEVDTLGNSNEIGQWQLKLQTGTKRPVGWVIWIFTLVLVAGVSVSAL